MNNTIFGDSIIWMQAWRKGPRDACREIHPEIKSTAVRKLRTMYTYILKLLSINETNVRAIVCQFLNDDVVTVIPASTGRLFVTLSLPAACLTGKCQDSMIGMFFSLSHGNTLNFFEWIRTLENEFVSIYFVASANKLVISCSGVLNCRWPSSCATISILVAIIANIWGIFGAATSTSVWRMKGCARTVRVFRIEHRTTDECGGGRFRCSGSHGGRSRNIACRHEGGQVSWENYRVCSIWNGIHCRSEQNRCRAHNFRIEKRMSRWKDIQHIEEMEVRK